MHTIRRRALRIALLVVGVPILLALLALLAGAGYLRTEAGQRRTARLLVERAGELLQGRLAAGRVELRGLVDICLRDVSLADPETGPVLSADALCVRLRPLALFDRKAAIRGVVIERPVIDVAALPGGQGTTLARALRPKRPPENQEAGPTAWAVELEDLDLHRGSLRLRPAPGAAPSLALDGIDIRDARARYAQAGARATLGMTAELLAPGKLPAALDLDAALDGEPARGRLVLHKLRLKLGETGIAASGQLQLGTRAGHLDIAELRVRPQDVQALREGAVLLAGEVRGKGRIETDGRTASARLALEAGGGRIDVEAEAGLAKDPRWRIGLQARGVDPGAVAPRAPSGKVTMRLEARGKGVPSWDGRGPRGDLEARLRVGPARLAQIGALELDLDARLRGRQGSVRRLKMEGLGLRAEARGAAALDAVDLDLAVDAPDLATVARAIGALTGKPAAALAGAARLEARVRGRPLAPDAEVHLRAPLIRSGDSLRAVNVAADGKLGGDLRRPQELKPKGQLLIVASEAVFGQTRLSQARMQLDLEWPGADLALTANVLGGRFDAFGEARWDEQGDGLRLPAFTIAWPGNELRLRRPVEVHFRKRETVVDPFWLEGKHGALGAAVTLRKGRPGSISAALELERFDLSRLPAFALPPRLDLAGLLGGKVTALGPMPRPAIDARLELRGGGVGAVRGLDLGLEARLAKDRFAAEVKGSGPAGVMIAASAEAPLGMPASLPAGAPLQGRLSIRELDLAQAAGLIGASQASEAGVRGKLALQGEIAGTVGEPRAALSLDVTRFSLVPPAQGPVEEKPAAPPETAGLAESRRKLGAAAGAFGMARAGPAPAPPVVREADVHLALMLERGLASLDGTAGLGGSERPVKLLARAPFDLGRALREPGYAAAAVERKLGATLTAENLALARLAETGLIPRGTGGTVTGSLDVAGTPDEPLLSVTAAWDDLTAGRLRGLGGNLRFDVDEQVRLQVGLRAGADEVAKLEMTLAASAQELARMRRLGDVREAARLLAERPLFGSLEVPGLYVGRAAALAGRERAPAEGKLVGSVLFGGTPGTPTIQGRLRLEEVATRARRLGTGEVYVEGGGAGAVVHVGISPPGGGTLLAHATLKADLTVKSLLATRGVGILQGELDGRLSARQLPLDLLSGAHPLLRRAAGTLEGDVEVKGLLGSPRTVGKASLRGGLLDVVGQGVFHDVDFDAVFSPKEIVLDRLVGQLGPGTFSAVLVAFRAGPAEEDRLEFTGELHLGDDESVRDRKDAKGKPLAKRPVPLRQAGEDRAELTGEVDLFGRYEASTLVATAKIPDASLRIISMPSKSLPPLKPNKDVMLLTPGERPHPPGVRPEELEAEEAARRQATFRARLALDLQRLHVRAEDFEFPVRSQLNFEHDARRPDQPTADGTVTISGGSFTALGRRFAIDNAVITETGGDIADPELEVKARYEKGGTVVFINVAGSARDPIVDLQSTPPMDQDAIAFFLATGRTQGKATQGGGGIDLQGAASSVMGSLLFDQVRQEITKVVPIDVLTFEAQGANIPQAIVGKYIGDSIFIGYRYQPTPAANENRNEGRIEYEISRSVTAEATVGDKNADVSILWSKDF